MANVNRRRQREYDQYEVNLNGVPFEGLTTPELRQEGRRLGARGWSFLTRNELIPSVIEANREHHLLLERRREQRQRLILLNRISRSNFPWYLENNISSFADQLPVRIPSRYENQEEVYSNAPIEILRFLARQQGYPDVDRLTRSQLMRRLMRLIE